MAWYKYIKSQGTIRFLLEYEENRKKREKDDFLRGTPILKSFKRLCFFFFLGGGRETY